MQNKSDRILSGTARGVFRSADAGLTYQSMGLEYSEIRTLGVDFSNSMVFAPAANMVHGRGLYTKHF